MARYSFVGMSARAKSLNADSLRLVNGYAEAVESKQGKTAVAVYGTPGAVFFLSLPGSGQMRGVYRAHSSRVFAVQGGGFYEVFENASAQLLGTLLTTSGPVSMVDNNLQLALVDGNYGYALDLATNVYGQITDPAFHGANTVAYLDGYFIFDRPGTGQFYISTLYSTSFNALDFATAEGSADYTLAVIAGHRELWVGGLQTIEVWFHSGATFPFSRVQGAFIDQGISGPHAMTRLANTIYWLSSGEQGGPIAYRANGYVPERISTHAQEAEWREYGTVADVIVWGQQDQGHDFCWFTFPTANKTWVYDGTEGLWHERSYRDPASGAEGRHLANCFSVGFGLHLVGDYQAGNIYALQHTAYTDGGVPLVFELALPPVAASETLNRVRHYELLVDAETGVGLDGAPPVGAQPQITLAVSNDGGHTWGSERAQSLGAIGKTRTRVGWHRLGAARDRRYRLRISDPVKRVILGATLTVEESAS